MHHNPMRHVDADTEPDVYLMLAIHGSLYMANLICYIWFPPIAAMKMLGNLPESLRSVAVISSLIQNNALHFFSTFAIVFVYLDIWSYLKLRHHWNRRAGAAWIAAIFAILLGALLFFIYGSMATLRG